MKFLPGVGMLKLTDSQLRILEKPEIECDDFIELLGEYVDGELTPTLHLRLADHAEGCEICEAFESSYRMVIDLAREIGNDNTPLPAGVRERLYTRLNAELGTSLEV